MHDSFLGKIEPTRVFEVVADSDWVTAMQEGLNQFDALKVWRLVPQPEGKTIIDMKWVFKNKKDEDGIVIRNKARILAKGYRQEEDRREDCLYEWHSQGGSLRLAALRFQMSMMGEMNFFPGLQVKQFSMGIFINQVKYIFDILRKFKMENCTPINPMALGTKIVADPSGKVVDVRTYKGFELTTYSDADHAGCMLDRKSTLGHIQFLGDKLVSWASKKQLCVSTSTVEAEYVAAASCCSQVLWLRTQLQDYSFKFDKILIYCDSKNAIAISANLVLHTKTKHIDVRYHFIKDNVEKGTIEL
ncbi:hypothetical protein L6452_35984 [Arctium lappa]|uniref:Uncharacterized protein n=1 Tax=Arctium lappa TaxID=4217 RepID=A0ACB8Y844_ARCLA|nr:hypothetical protein L6452_35984 [Arctium lappa]